VGWAGWAAGAHTVGVTYNGDGNYNSTSTSIPLTISPAPQIISFPAPISPVQYGVSPITLSATGGASLNPVIYSVLSGPGTVSNNKLSITGVAPVVVVAANQAGNSNYLAAPQVTQFVVVNIATPIMTLGPSQNPVSPSTVSYLSWVTFWASFSPGPTGFPSGPTGTVTFYDSGAAIGNTPVVIGTASINPQTGIAAFPIDTLTAGNHYITASWPGNTDYTPVTSTPIKEGVIQGTPSVPWPTPTPISYGTTLSPTQLNASASYDGSSLNGTYSYSPSAGTILNAGSQTLSVTFVPSDTLDYTSPVAHVQLTVNQATPTLSVATSGTPSTFGSSVTFTATISSGPTGTVTFYDSGSAIGTGTISGTTATFTTTNLAVGTHSITSYWAGNTNYKAVTSSATTQTVNPAAPSLNVATSGTPSTYGGSVIFTANISSGPTGSVTFYDSGTAIGTGMIVGTTATFTTGTLTAGAHIITAGWSGNTNYKAVTSSAFIQTVNKSTPIITWATPSAITYGTTLSATQLDASASVAGTYAYSPASGTVLSGGSQMLSVMFTPTDTTDYNTAIGTVILTVNKVTPTITWATPSAIRYGTTLSATQLDATASVAGTYAYSPASGTVLSGGSQMLSLTFTPTDTTDYNTAIGTVILTVNKAIPTITWVSPAVIPYWTALSAIQLNATANVPGTFVYSPPAGTIVTVTLQTLSVTFTPNDTTDYATTTATVATVSPGEISTVAGGGSGCPQQTNSVGDNCQATSAELSNPRGTAIDAAGNLYIADTGNNVIRKVSVPTGVITTVAGIGGAGGYSGDFGPALSAELNGPSGVAVDTAGNIYIADEGNNCIREVALSNGVIFPVAGNCFPNPVGYNGSYCCDGYLATQFGEPGVTLGSPTGVALDPSGNLYIQNTSDFLINEVNASTNKITTLAYETSIPYFWEDNSFLLTSPGITLDSSGNIYFADSGACAIQELSPSTGYISTVAGGVNSWWGAGDGGLATDADLCSSSGVAVDGRGNIFIVSTLSNTVREVTAADGIINTVAGNGTQGYSGDGGPALSAELYWPSGVSVDTSGHLYVADSFNNRIREVTLTTFNPAITWQNPAPISYGTALSASQLNATANTPGTFAYSPAAGTILTVGSNTLSVTFTPTDTTDYTTITATVSLTVDPATPSITWPTPSPISYGTALSAKQLDASSTVAGTFVYSPVVGTILPVGPATLSATFYPADTVDYTVTTVTAYATITEDKLTWDNGTVTLTVNSNPITTATVTYGATSTPTFIAETLAALASSSQVTVKAIDDSLYIEATNSAVSTNGLALTDFPYSVSISDTAGFSEPSFSASPAGGMLDGAAYQNTAGAIVYQFTVPQGGYDYAGNLLSYNDLSGTQPLMGRWNFQYDTLNRLISGSASTGPYAGQYFCWGYDPFGNRTAQTQQSGACPTLPSMPTPTASFNGNNQVTWTTFNSAVNGFAYDGAGDVVNDNVNQYLYDGDGRICAVASTPISGMTILTGYIYDAGGTRVSKGSINAWSCDPILSGFTTVNDYILGPGGEQVTEMGMGSATVGSSTSGLTWQHTNVYAGGTLLGTYDNDGLHFYLNDPLGTRRAQTDYAGVLEQTCQSLPYGDGLNCTGSITAPTEHHFTGKERDAESGNDYFDARYYSSSMGRFMSPDWAAQEEPVPYAVLDDPQSLNLYSYVRNNPLGRTDPDGHCPDDDDACLAAGDTLAGTPFHNLSFKALVVGVLQDLANMLPVSENPNAGPANPATTPEEAQGQQAGAIVIGLGGGAFALPEAAPAEAEAAGAAADADAAAAKPSEAYNRRAHYGDTPTAADKKAVGGESVDHDPPLVKRYYEGDAAKGEKPGHQQTPAERKASANDRTRMRPSTKDAQRRQGGQMSNYSKQQKKKNGLN
jgi:RHS repeat-associated protein